jgi:hypothetical protein
MSFGTMLAIASLSGPVFAADGDAMQSYAKARDNFMLDLKPMMKDGMISKKDFMDMMSKKFDAMDAQKKGVLSQADVMKIFGYQDRP